MAIYIGLGANMPAAYRGKATKPKQSLKLALGVLADKGVNIVCASHIWQSPAWPDPQAQPPYENAVAEIETSFKPLKLLNILKLLEFEFGRRETVRNAARPLDLDILDYHGQKLNTQRLTLPHPRMCARAFVLFPLLDIAPDWLDPIKNRTAQDWTTRLALSDVESLKRGNSLYDCL